MKKVMPPPDASINVQKAITDTQANIDELNDKASDVIHREEFEKALEEIRGALGLASRKKPLDINDVFRGGASSAHGYVPDPGNQTTGGPTYLTSDGEFAPLLDGALVSGDPGVGGSSLAQKVVEVHGSLAVTSALQAENIRSRSSQVIHNLDVGGIITGTIAASNVSATTVSGAQTFLTASDVQSDLYKLDTENLFQVIPHGACGTSLAQRTAQLNGSLVVLNAIGARRIECGMPNLRVLGVSITHSLDQTINTSSPTVLSFDTTLFDSSGFHSNTTNNSRITIPSGLGGYYLIIGSMRWEDVNDQDSFRAIRIELNSNGTPTVGNSFISGISNQGSTGADIVTTECHGVSYLKDGDVIEAIANQQSGSAIKVQTISNGQSPMFTAIRIGW